MNTMRWFTIPVTLATGLLVLACQSPRPTAPPKAPPLPAVPSATEAAPGNTFSGTIVHIRPSVHLLTVKSTADQKDFVVGSKTPVFTETSRHGALSTLNVGDLVEVEYEQHDAVATATRIVRTAVAAGEKPAPEVERLEKMLNPDPSNPNKTD
ncbi:MAG TPA: hypothetical protein VL486_03690 [Verrucomicrobiae bacterium]|nr:hypothetical protein [Verrucomicrobiae bacterium]